MMASTASKRRTFAPLSPGAAASNAPKLKGVVFDVDGTLWYVLHLTNKLNTDENHPLTCVSILDMGPTCQILKCYYTYHTQHLF